MAATWGQAKLVRHCQSSTTTSRAKTPSSTGQRPSTSATPPRPTLLETHRTPGQVGQNQMVTGTQPLDQRRESHHRQLLVVATTAKGQQSQKEQQGCQQQLLQHDKFEQHIRRLTDPPRGWENS